SGINSASSGGSFPVGNQTPDAPGRPPKGANAPGRNSSATQCWARARHAARRVEDVFAREGDPDGVVAGDGLQRPERGRTGEGAARIAMNEAAPPPGGEERRLAHTGVSSMTRRRFPLQVRTS